MPNRSMAAILGDSYSGKERPEKEMPDMLTIQSTRARRACGEMIVEIARSESIS